MDFPDDADTVNLLGRADFFERYVIQFWDAAEMMNIDTSPGPPAACALTALLSPPAHR